MKKLLASGATGLGMLLMTAMPVAADFTGVNNATANNNVSLQLGSGANTQTAIASFLGQDVGENTLTIDQTLVSGNIEAIVQVMNHLNGFDECLCDFGDDISMENTAEANTTFDAVASSSSNGQVALGGFGDAESDEVNLNTAAITQALGTGTVSVGASLWNVLNSSFTMTP